MNFNTINTMLEASRIVTDALKGNDDAKLGKDILIIDASKLSIAPLTPHGERYAFDEAAANCDMLHDIGFPDGFIDGLIERSGMEQWKRDCLKKLYREYASQKKELEDCMENG